MTTGMKPNRYRFSCRVSPGATNITPWDTIMGDANINPDTNETLIAVVNNSVTSVYINSPPVPKPRSRAGSTRISTISSKKTKETALPAKTATTHIKTRRRSSLKCCSKVCSRDLILCPWSSRYRQLMGRAHPLFRPTADPLA